MANLKARDLLAVRQVIHDRKRARDTRARAMRPPDPAVISFTRDILGVVKAWENLVLEKMRPQLVVFEGSTTGAHSGPDPLDAQIGTLRTDMLPSGADRTIQELHDIIDQFLRDQGINRILDDNVGRVNAWTLKELSASLGIDITAAGLGLGGVMESFRTENVLRIKRALGGSLQDMANLLDSQIGMRVEDIATNIEQGFGVTRSRAMLLARDQTLKLNAQVTMQRQNEVGVTHYVWVTSHDERVRGNPNGKWPTPRGGGGDHFSLDGKTFSWLEPPVTNTRTGDRNHPGEDYQCRCTATPVLTGILD